jgi:hypothetical protein
MSGLLGRGPNGLLSWVNLIMSPGRSVGKIRRPCLFSSRGRQRRDTLVTPNPQVLEEIVLCIEFQTMDPGSGLVSFFETSAGMQEFDTELGPLDSFEETFLTLRPAALAPTVHAALELRT